MSPTLNRPETCLSGAGSSLARRSCMTSDEVVKKRAGIPSRQAAAISALARWVLPVPTSP